MKKKKVEPSLGSQYKKYFSSSADQPMPESLKQPEQLKVVESRTVYGIFELPEKQEHS